MKNIKEVEFSFWGRLIDAIQREKEERFHTALYPNTWIRLVFIWNGLLPRLHSALARARLACSSPHQAEALLRCNPRPSCCPCCSSKMVSHPSVRGSCGSPFYKPYLSVLLRLGRFSGTGRLAGRDLESYCCGEIRNCAWGRRILKTRSISVGVENSYGENYGIVVYKVLGFCN